MRASKKPRNQPDKRQKESRGAADNDHESAVAISQTEHWSGPLPSPEALSRFNEVVENGAERIMRGWEIESDHRRAMENAAVRAEIWERIIARVSAAAFAFGALALSAYAASIDQATVASVVGGSTIAAVVAAMVYTRR